jgi:serine protease inhibitor
MTNTLQLQELGSEPINTGYAGLRQALQTSDPKVTLAIANSLWARQDVPFKQDFLQRNTQFFGAEVSTLDFTDPNTLTTINQWVNTNTNGKIPEILDEINPDAVLFLLLTLSISKGRGRQNLLHHTRATEPSILQLVTKSRSR